MSLLTPSHLTTLKKITWRAAISFSHPTIEFTSFNENKLSMAMVKSKKKNWVTKRYQKALEYKVHQLQPKTLSGHCYNVHSRAHACTPVISDSLSLADRIFVK